MAYLLGLFDRLDGYNLDLHFRHCNSIQADPRIVLIDIDDSTLAAMPNWPWPRRVFADLVRTLDELGPQAIVLDIIFDQPSSPRAEHAGLTRHIDDHTTVLGNPAFDETIYDDKELCYALADAGNVYLAMAGDIGESAASAYGERPSTWSPPEKIDPAVVRDPCGDILQFTEIPLMRETETPGHNAQVRAHRRRFTKQVVALKLSDATLEQAELAPTAFALTPPLETLAAAAKGVGLVSYHRKSVKSVVHELPFVTNAERSLLPQLGVLVGAAVVSANAPTISLKDNAWVFAEGDERRSAPVDRLGYSLVNWCAPRGYDWRSSFAHVPADRLLEIVENRRTIEGNHNRLGIVRAELVGARFAETPTAYTDYVRLVNDQLELERTRKRGSPPSRRPSPLAGEGERPAALDEKINAVEDEAVAWVQRAWGLWKGATPQDELERFEKDRIKALYDRFGEGQYPAHIAEINAKLEKRNRELRTELGPQLRDKICLVGYTATAMADVVPTPVDPAMPGVMVHANVINMFLQNRFASAAPASVNVLVIFAVGLLTTFVAARSAPRTSVPVVILVAAATLAAGALAFWVWTYHIAALASVVSLLFTWAGVTVYRQATEERARRHLQRALAQYTSPAVATRIVDTARAEGLTPRVARVSCFFSDLADFTVLSEKLGPDRTRELLNPYLREVSSAILRHNGMVNKFIGDGVFAFFNAPLLPCAKHADAACRSALEALAAVRTLGEAPWALAAGWTLKMRIGLSTGEAFAGDYGSDMKLDYTCIGDTVNVAERLERANKVLGTTILVDDETRREAGADFVFRSLGRIEVPGRSAPVAVHELVGLSGHVNEAQRRAIAHFEEAIRCFQTCQWDSCLAMFAEYRRISPTDAAADRYQRAVGRLRNHTPPGDWNGALSLAPL